MADLDTPFPTLQLDAEPAWAWPQPPFARRDVLAPLGDAVEPCRIETPIGRGGRRPAGSLRHRRRRRCAFAVALAASRWRCPFARFSRLTLTTPRPLMQRRPERAGRACAHRRAGARLPHRADRRGPTEWPHAGPCECRHRGWFLFAPHDDGEALLRVFVPHAAVAAIGFDKSAEEQAAERWIATPAQLLAALEAQQRARHQAARRGADRPRPGDPRRARPRRQPAGCRAATCRSARCWSTTA